MEDGPRLRKLAHLMVNLEAQAQNAWIRGERDRAMLHLEERERVVTERSALMREGWRWRRERAESRV